MATKIQIINLAVIRLGGDPIAALYPDETSKTATHASYVWDMDLKAMLEDFAWSFAQKTVALALLVATPILEEWEYAYTLPADCVKPNALANSQEELSKDDSLLPMSVQTMVIGGVTQKVLLCNVVDAYLRYTAIISNFELLSPLAVSCLAYKIAASLALSITSSPKKAEAMQKGYILELEKATASDASRDTKPRTAYTDSWISARG